MNHRRRRLLRAVVTAGSVGVAGCGTSGQNNTDPPSSPTDSRSPSRTTPTSPGLTPTPPGTPVQNPFTFDVEVVNAEPTPEDPPIVRITVTNDDDEAHSLSTSTYQFPFTATYAETDAATLVVLTRLSDWDNRGGECWAGLVKTQPATNGKSLQPGESVSAERAVMNAIEGNSESPAVCWPRDTFLFTHSYALDSSEPGLFDGEKFSWGFRVRVTAGPAIQVGAIQPFSKS
jgi:hypothetical protein